MDVSTLTAVLSIAAVTWYSGRILCDKTVWRCALNSTILTTQTEWKRGYVYSNEVSALLSSPLLFDWFLLFCSLLCSSLFSAWLLTPVHRSCRIRSHIVKRLDNNIDERDHEQLVHAWSVEKACRQCDVSEVWLCYVSAIFYFWREKFICKLSTLGDAGSESEKRLRSLSLCCFHFERDWVMCVSVLLVLLMPVMLFIFVWEYVF